MMGEMTEESWQPTAAGRHLAGRRKTNTTPEVALRKALHVRGGRYRLHVRLAKGCTPDLVMPKWRLAVFVDGCYWHSCPVHGRKTPFTGPNAALWEEKMRRNRERDVVATGLAEALGWRVLRLWECEILPDAGAAAGRVLAVAREVT
jgi:DNA mismatch endonuclease (patch repair protein)